MKFIVMYSVLKACHASLVQGFLDSVGFRMVRGFLQRFRVLTSAAQQPVLSL